MKRRTLTFSIVAIFLAWNIIAYVFILSKQPSKDVEERREELTEQFAELQKRLKAQALEHNIIRHELQQARSELEAIIVNKHLKEDIVSATLPTGARVPAIAVLVMACDRVTVSRSIDQLLKYRPSADQFPIIVSQDCGHLATANVIQSYGEKLTHIEHPDRSVIQLSKKDSKFRGYYLIARHYKWALNQVFYHFNYSVAVVVEDDLDISPDFFDYFLATYPVLHADASLWCVSAWNDNGKADLVSDEPELLYRTDFFPGLGWMLERSVWQELEPKWPITFWDDWMRQPAQRRERACIRPEIPRTSTFGKVGVSKGQYFEKHLKFIRHNVNPVSFTKLDVSYLLKDNYDRTFVEKVYSSPQLAASQVVAGLRPSKDSTIRVQYSDLASFKAAAKLLGTMDDVKSGVPRSGYRGIVSIMVSGRRIYLSPPADWKGYDTSWK